MFNHHQFPKPSQDLPPRTGWLETTPTSHARAATYSIFFPQRSCCTCGGLWMLFEAVGGSGWLVWAPTAGYRGNRTAPTLSLSLSLPIPPSWTTHADPPEGPTAAPRRCVSDVTSFTRNSRKLVYAALKKKKINLIQKQSGAQRHHLLHHKHSEHC